MAALKKSGRRNRSSATGGSRADAASCSKAFLQCARTEKIDGVLGIGGGSAIDVAKLVAALVARKANH